MRLAYATTDEVNQALAIRMSAAFGALVCRLRPGDALPEGLFDAILCDLDHMLGDERAAFVDGLCLEPPGCPTAVHGYGVTDEQAEELRRHGVAVSQRLRSGLLRRLCAAAQSRLATVSRGGILTDLTWVNVVE